MPPLLGFFPSPFFIFVLHYCLALSILSSLFLLSLFPPLHFSTLQEPQKEVQDKDVDRFWTRLEKWDRKSVSCKLYRENKYVNNYSGWEGIDKWEINEATARADATRSLSQHRQTEKTFKETTTLRGNFTRKMSMIEALCLNSTWLNVLTQNSSKLEQRWWLRSKQGYRQEPNRSLYLKQKKQAGQQNANKKRRQARISKR